jgi:chromosome segregation ATPase
MANDSEDRREDAARERMREVKTRLAELDASKEEAVAAHDAFRTRHYGHEVTRGRGLAMEGRKFLRSAKGYSRSRHNSLLQAGVQLTSMRRTLVGHVASVRSAELEISTETFGFKPDWARAERRFRKLISDIDNARTLARTLRNGARVANENLKAFEIELLGKEIPFAPNLRKDLPHDYLL